MILKIRCLFIVLLIISSYSCESKKEIELDIQNDTLHYATIFSAPKDSTDFEIINSVYPRYKNSGDWTKSVNKVQYKIINNTNEKLLIIDPKDIKERLFTEDSINVKSNIYCQIMDSKNMDLPVIGFSTHQNLPLHTKEVSEQYKRDSIAVANTTYSSYDNEKRLRRYRVLNPNESIDITTRLSLPIPIDYDNLIDINFGLPMYKTNNYKAMLHLVMNKKDIEDNMPKQILDSLKREKVVIRDLFLSSKEIIIMPNNSK